MKNYIKQMHEKPAHERRRFSMRMAVGITTAVFLVWLSTLGLRLAGDPTDQQSSDLVAATSYSEGLQGWFSNVPNVLQVVNVDGEATGTAEADASLQSE